MSSDAPKGALFEAFANVARAIGHPTRLELVEQLAQGERNVEALAARLGLPFASASQHLQALRRAGLVVARRSGKRMIYRLADAPATLAVLGAVGRFAVRHRADVARVVTEYFQARDAMEPVSRAALLDRARRGTVTVLDVRPPDEFALGHLPDAVNIPFAELRRRLSELPARREIVAYCRGPWCVLAFEAVAMLRDNGLRARRLEDGFPEWQAAGLPTAKAA